jgi:hypothetical protein
MLSDSRTRLWNECDVKWRLGMSREGYRERILYRRWRGCAATFIFISIQNRQLWLYQRARVDKAGKVRV